MVKSLHGRVRVLVVCIASLCMLALFAACAGVPTTGSSTVTGTVKSVNQQAGSAVVTVTVNGASHDYTINGLTQDQVAQLQPGQSYSFQVTQNGDNSFTITTGSSPQVTTNTNTGPTVTATTANTTTNNQPTGGNQGPSQPGSIDFYGKVQSINGSSITVTMPNGDAITAALNTLTQRGDNFVGQPTVGQEVKLTVVTNTDGSFLAQKLDGVKPEDQANQFKLAKVDFAGVTTSAVGSDNVIHFKVGNKTYSYTIVPGTTEMKDFVSPQSIQANQPVKVEVQFNGANGTVTQVKSGVND